MIEYIFKTQDEDVVEHSFARDRYVPKVGDAHVIATAILYRILSVKATAKKVVVTVRPEPATSRLKLKIAIKALKTIAFTVAYPGASLNLDSEMARKALREIKGLDTPPKKPQNAPKKAPRARVGRGRA